DKQGHVRIGPILPEGATVSVRAQELIPVDAIAVPDPLPGEMEIALVRAGALEGRVVDARGFPIDGATIEVVGTDFNGAPIDDDPRHRAFRAAHFTASLAGPSSLIPMGELGVVPGPVPPIPHAGSAPIARAGATGPDAQPWVTRADGTFKIEPVSPGRVRLVVRHPQYVETTSEVVTLRSAKEAHVDVVMHQGGSLEGRVVDGNGQAARGIRVTVSATKGSLERTTLSADDGSFAFASLPPEVSISAASEDEPSATLVKLELAIAEGAKRTITLTLPGARSPLKLQVTDDRDYPVDAAQVTALSLDPSAPLRTTAFTDARGEAELPNASGLPLRLEVSSPGHAPKVVTVDPAAPPSKIVLGRAESATGEVSGVHGDPIADADVAIYTQLGVRRARTDAKGLFAIDGLAPGAAELRVRAKGHAPTKRNVTIVDQQALRPTELPRVELDDEAVVEGTVLDSHRDPVQGARVGAGGVAVYVQAGSNPPGTTVSDRSGKFRLGELPAGTTTIEAYAPDTGRGQATAKLVSGRTVDVTITLGGETSSAESNATGSVAVTLGVTDADDIVLVDVVEGSAAERGGLAPGDVLVTIDGKAVHALADARSRLNGPVADDVVLVIRRGDTTSTLRVEREAVRR
ncbi:MAG TPA: carboxypeptidase regulatory-like domain-containing protein, partial [Polyangiaceae bacterium]